MGPHGGSHLGRRQPHHLAVALPFILAVALPFFSGAGAGEGAAVALPFFSGAGAGEGAGVERGRFAALDDAAPDAGAVRFWPLQRTSNEW